MGLVGARLGAVLLTPFLYEVPPQSPALHLGVGGLLACVAAVVATAAARQTGKIPVATLLKAE
jgi:hypothetical protein